MSQPLRFIQLTDLHLSDSAHTTTAKALRWAVSQINQTQADFLIVSGDVTTWGTAPSAHLFLCLIQAVQMPIYFTPGNAEHRSPGAIPILQHQFPPTKQTVYLKNQLFMFPDTSRGNFSETEKKWMNTLLSQHPTRSGCVIITHYPTDALDRDSCEWLTNWCQQNSVDVLVAGHKHSHRSKPSTTTEFITRGLDPDKASGDLPGLSIFERTPSTGWSETFMPWSFPVELLPCEGNVPSPVGWSIQGDPIITVQETVEFGLNCLELRPATLDFSVQTLKEELTKLRNDRPIYLSWHLPSLSFKNGLTGASNIQAHLDIALEMGVHHLTIHVPQAPAHTMVQADLYQQFEEVFDHLFRPAVQNGVRLAIENVHNNSGVRATDPICKFATDIPNYIQWLTAMKNRFGNIPHAQVGAHFDVGHARNNGAYGNQYPLADWYAQVGHLILGYHIHQIGSDPITGKTKNHIEMHTPFDLRISYAGFIHAWTTRQINRAPLFVEIRDHDQRRRSTRRLQTLFQNASNIHTSLDLPGRP